MPQWSVAHYQIPRSHLGHTILQKGEIPMNVAVKTWLGKIFGFTRPNVELVTLRKEFQKLQGEHVALQRHYRSLNRAHGSLVLCKAAQEVQARAQQQWCTDMILVGEERIRQLERERVELLRRANEDELTGLPNRFGLKERFWAAYAGLKQELAKPASVTPDNRQLSVDISEVVIDLDHFKTINDTHGHAAGDQILVEMAKRIRRDLSRRLEDTLGVIYARVGGEEFVVILPHADAAGALKRVTFFAEEVARTPFSVTVDGQETQVWVTISAGVATLQLTPETTGVPEEEYQKLFERADKALYIAKRPDPPSRGTHGGRNRVVPYRQDLED